MYISPNDITAFEEQDIETVLADELADSEDRYESTSHPTAVLLAGQPGAGKTELASAMSGMLDDNAFFINADIVAGIQTIAPYMNIMGRTRYK